MVPRVSRIAAGIVVALTALLAFVGTTRADDASLPPETWWALRTVSRPEIPGVRDAARVANPIDAFILARLDAENMRPAPPAERRVLVRRLFFDLVGLPPSSADVDEFLADSRPDAWERLVDRLLASPRFGERWGRYWLDLVRFAETNGYERDATKRGAWKYRDWVIDSLNRDQPYDRFVIEQLAGDELPDRSERTVTGTGFLRLGTWDDEPNEPLDYQYERLEDLVHATSTTFLAYTVKCARCHDHRFDPIPQVDYYRMASAFWAGYIEPRDRKYMGGPSRDELGFDVLGWTDRGRDVPSFHFLTKGDPHRPEAAVSPGALSAVRALPNDIPPPPEGAATTRRRLGLARWIADRRNPLTARVIVNRLWQHHFGDGIARTPSNFGTKGDPPTHPVLLDWLASEAMDGGWRLKRIHRLIVTSNAYRMSPLHPTASEYDLRDSENRLLWRANRRRLEAEALRDAMLVASGELNERMGGESFFPRLSREALEGLSRKGASWGTSTAEERLRRSIYIFTKRSLLVPLMTAFDLCDSTAGCAKRDVTTVAPQALALLNNHFVHERSQAFARRLLAEERDVRDRVRRAWRLAFGRPPSAGEIDGSLAHVREQRAHFERVARGKAEARPSLGPNELAWASLCHVLLNTNEFIYVD